MRALTSTLRPALTLLAGFTLLCGFVYPAIGTLIVQGLFPEKAEGSLLRNDKGVIIGSLLIAQPFTQDKYFWPRPSATTPPYNAAASGGSNLGVANPVLHEQVKSRVAALREGGMKAPAPIDLVTASGSGLDPHISPKAAEAQVARVAKARHRSESEIKLLVKQHTQPRQLGILGEPRVNVLTLNIALDK